MVFGSGVSVNAVVEIFEENIVRSCNVVRFRVNEKVVDDLMFGDKEIVVDDIDPNVSSFRSNLYDGKEVHIFLVEIVVHIKKPDFISVAKVLIRF